MPHSPYYDDRLATAISGALPDAALAAVQYRQIIDLLADATPAISEDQAATMRHGNQGRYYSQVDFAAALVRLNALGQKIPLEKQADALRESRRFFRSPPLIRYLLEQAKPVRDAALVKARLPAEQWLEIIKTLSPEQRAELMHRVGIVQTPEQRDNTAPASTIAGNEDADSTAAIGASAADEPDDDQQQADNGPQTDQSATDIGDLVDRIADFTARRDASYAPHLPLEGFTENDMTGISEICFVSDKGGYLVSVDPDCDGMADGLPVFVRAMAGSCGCDANTARLAGQFRPIVDGRYVHRGSAALAGEWRVDAWPRFASGYDGQFIGYCGVLTRLVEAQDAEPEALDHARTLSHEDYRQLVHELRTPAGALKGFAEILQTQLFGPVASPYRDMAHAIIADTDIVLAQLAELPLGKREDA
ncbi:hypothetical protein [Alterisphingorhabdus coralli]|uniref:histidine kinase n=1 Tax=Alterisphingorhabdus coralli TaxID=3071408 RepID=A0AA97I0D3_9SPHN|nr:hypothetical protein [Parasphingorhabdus sp. SCSIO 66989]WOE74070.1 hypothetical protein RB602_09385 [Parasphingorhabdus sp. SCSIO 66989]